MGVRAIILLVLMAGSIPVCFWRPFYGIALWVVISFLNPQAYVWGAGAAPWAVMVAVPTVLGFLIFSRGWIRRVCTLETLLLLVLWVWFTITTWVDTRMPVFQHHAADTWFRWNFVSKVLLMTVVTVGVVDSFARLRKLVMVIAGCFGFYVVKSLPFMIITAGSQRLYGPEASMIADNNDFGLALNMTLPLFFFLSQTETDKRLRYLFRFLFVVTIPAIFFTYSRGALLGLIAVMVLMFLQSKQRLVLGPVIAVGMLVAILFAPEAWRNRMDPTRSDAVDASAASRINSWTFSWRLAADYPVTGGGFDTFTRPLFDRYAPNTADLHGPHSVYFGVLAEHGFVGLFLYMTLVTAVFLSAHLMVWRARREGRDDVVNYANMFRFGLVGFLVSGAFLGRAYFDYFFMLIACVAILKNVYRSERAAEEEPAPEEFEEIEATA
jgi:probable O-glycosylation ligase (exosortase A-associated)